MTVTQLHLLDNGNELLFEMSYGNGNDLPFSMRNGLLLRGDFPNLAFTSLPLAFRRSLRCYEF